MNRNYIMLLALLFPCPGCSDRSTPTSPQHETNAATESKPDTEPGGEDRPPEDGDTLNSSPADALAQKDAMTLYREAQAMMKDGKLATGYETAGKAMAQFIAEDIDLPWMLLESIDAGDKRIDVHFNMGERERDMPGDGIVRPLSFRIWSAGEDSEFLQVIDFEIGRSDGEPMTAAIGEMTETGHANYGILDVDAEYETIRKRVVELITEK